MIPTRKQQILPDDESKRVEEIAELTTLNYPSPKANRVLVSRSVTAVSLFVCRMRKA